MNNNILNEIQSRTLLLLGEEKFQKLHDSHILVVGAGGVGGYAVEQLSRAGVGEITLIDADIVNLSNINRQIIASVSNVNKPKVLAFEERIKDINPEIKLNVIQDFFNEDKLKALFSEKKFDYVVDAIDTLSPKIALLKTCVENNIPVVSSMGAGGKLNPTKVEITDLSKTYNCNLARHIRKRLGRIGIRKGIKAVFSSEIISKDSIVLEKTQNKNSNVGTISYMPAIFGLFCASVVIRDLIEK